MTAKSASIKGAERKSGGCVRKAVGLTSGDLCRVLESGLRRAARPLNAAQKSAEAVVPAGSLARKGRRKGRVDDRESRRCHAPEIRATGTTVGRKG